MVLLCFIQKSAKGVGLRSGVKASGVQGINLSCHTDSEGQNMEPNQDSEVNQ